MNISIAEAPLLSSRVIAKLNVCEGQNRSTMQGVQIKLKHFWEASKPLWLGLAAFVVLGALLADVAILMSHIDWT